MVSKDHSRLLDAAILKPRDLKTLLTNGITRLFIDVRRPNGADRLMQSKGLVDLNVRRRTYIQRMLLCQRLTGMQTVPNSCASSGE